MKLRYEIPLIALMAILLSLTATGCLFHPPGPGPGPGPTPVKVDKLVVLIVEESSDRRHITHEHLNVMMSTRLRVAVTQAGGEFLLLDKDANVTHASQWVRDAMQVPRTSLPWLIVASKKGGTSLALPASVDEVLLVIEKYRG